MSAYRSHINARLTPRLSSCSDAMFVEDLPDQEFLATPEAKDPTDRSLVLLDQRVQAVNEIGIDAFDGLNDREVEM